MDNIYNNPIVTDTDLHARVKGALKELGRARIKAKVEGTEEKETDEDSEKKETKKKIKK